MTAAKSLRIFLEEIVDYAGLFPPASLDMRRAVECYAEYAMSDDAWALGRFVVPIAHLDAFADAWAGLPPREWTGGAGAWRLSALAGSDPIADIPRVQEFNARNVAVSSPRIDTLEARLTSPGDIARVAYRLPKGVRLFVEIPTEDDPASLISAIAVARAGAKIRTGGVTADAFPSSRAVARFLQQCVAGHTAFKATAGLHHPVRGEYRLTYAVDAERATMFGFLNVFLAAAFVRNGASHGDAVAILECDDARMLSFSTAGATWKGRSLSVAQLRAVRAEFALSFGSCSFREPLDELRGLTLL
jgi:hypothetical protein